MLPDVSINQPTTIQNVKLRQKQDQRKEERLEIKTNWPSINQSTPNHSEGLINQVLEP